MALEEGSYAKAEALPLAKVLVVVLVCVVRNLVQAGLLGRVLKVVKCPYIEEFPS